MNQQGWRQAWDVFTTARDMPSAEQRAYAESSITDPEALEEVLAMLASAASPDAGEHTLFSSADPSRPAEWSRLGQTFGRFVVTGPLGRGGMGEVYRAQDTELNRTVALKFLAPGAIGGPEMLIHFLREARAASALNHPGIVTVHDVLRTHSTVGIVMELIDGIPVRTICGTPHPSDRVAGWGSQIAMALAAAHSSGIVHRDIKPENLMLRPDGLIKVLDFGLARQVDGSVLTSVNRGFAGTLRYMSPEQVHGEASNAPSDIFALGIVLYELVTGVHPFGVVSMTSNRSPQPHAANVSPSGFDALLVPHAIATHEPVAPSNLQPSICPELDRLVLQMLAKDPAKRPAADEVARAVDKTVGY